MRERKRRRQVGLEGGGGGWTRGGVLTLPRITEEAEMGAQGRESKRQ